MMAPFLSRAKSSQHTSRHPHKLGEEGFKQRSALSASVRKSGPAYLCEERFFPFAFNTLLAQARVRIHECSCGAVPGTSPKLCIFALFTQAPRPIGPGLWAI
jgi:hypothetical protein